MSTSSNAKNALVLGATGGIGGEIADKLVHKGWHIVGLARDVDTATRSKLVGSKVDWVEGDAMTQADVVRAAQGVSVIVHAVNPPGYRNWKRVVLPMIDNTIAAARAQGGARIVLPGTVYNFDPATTPTINEHTRQNAITRKGRIRVELERRLEAAAPEVPSLILRAGDFIGTNARASWFSQGMVKPGKRVSCVVSIGHGEAHAYAYLPDLAETFACLIDQQPKLRPFERLQFAGHWDASGHEMTDAIRRVIGRQVPERAFPWWLMRLLAPLGGFPREAVEIEPVWRHPMRLDNSRLLELLGEEPHTPLDQAIKLTLEAIGSLELVKSGEQSQHC